jgi:hypothetical protein
MARFSQGFRTTATSNAVIEFIGATGRRPQLIELGITLNAATATQVGLGYPAAQGVTPTTPVTLLTESDNATTTIASALAWATAPTIPAYFYRRASLPAVVGAQVIWNWPSGSSGLLLAASSSLILWLFAAGSVIDGWAVFEE